MRQLPLPLVYGVNQDVPITDFTAGDDLDLFVTVSGLAGAVVEQAQLMIKRLSFDPDSLALVSRVIDTTPLASGQIVDIGASGSAQMSFVLDKGDTALLDDEAIYDISVLYTDGSLQTVAHGMVNAQGQVALGVMGASTPPGATPTGAFPIGPAGGILEGSYPNPELVDTAVVAGQYGDESHIGQFTVDDDGRLTQAANIPINIGAEYEPDVSTPGLNEIAEVLTGYADYAAAVAGSQFSIVDDGTPGVITSGVPGPYDGHQVLATNDSSLTAFKHVAIPNGAWQRMPFYYRPATDVLTGVTAQLSALVWQYFIGGGFSLSVNVGLGRAILGGTFNDGAGNTSNYEAPGIPAPTTSGWMEVMALTDYPSLFTVRMRAWYRFGGVVVFIGSITIPRLYDAAGSNVSYTIQNNDAGSQTAAGRFEKYDPTLHPDPFNVLAILTQGGPKDNDILALPDVPLNGTDIIGSSRAPALLDVGAAGTYGDDSTVPVLTTDDKGRVTSVTETPINFPSTAPSGPAGGDLDGTYPDPTLAASGVSAATYGDATHVPQVTFDAKGRATNASNVLIAGAAPSGPAGGDLSGTFPNPTLAAIGSAGTTGDADTAAQVTIDTKGRVTALVARAMVAAATDILTAGAVNTSKTPNARRLVAGSNISFDDSVANVRTVAAAGSLGEANTASNVGAGAGVWKDKSGVDLRFRSIVAGAGVSATQNADDVTIAATGGGSEPLLFLSGRYV